MTYVRPSQCDQCTPVEEHEAGTAHLWTVTYSHQPDCPNHPAAKTKRRTTK